MKVFVLPVLPFKECLFTSRLVAYNLTFALLKGKDPANRAVDDAQKSLLWHEETSGRNGEDIVSAYWKWLCLQRDRKKITLFVDNCPAQNKQWKLFSCLLFAVNSRHIQANEISLKFLEKGHTFMSADSWHHQCEQSLRKKVIADFMDFQKAISSKMSTLTLGISDFADWPNIISRHRINSYENKPLMEKFSVVKFVRGSNSIHVKFNFDDANFEAFDLMKKNADAEILPPMPRRTARGIPAKKKEGLMNLCRLMDDSRRGFWENLRVDNSTPDLAAFSTRV